MVFELVVTQIDNALRKLIIELFSKKVICICINETKLAIANLYINTRNSFSVKLYRSFSMYAFIA